MAAEKQFYDDKGNYLDGPHYGKDCPQGKVQVEFVGCDPRERFSPYAWKPVDRAFIEVYVDGHRFRISIGDFESIHGGVQRGLEIVTDRCDLQAEQHSVNGVALTFKEKPHPTPIMDNTWLLP